MAGTEHPVHVVLFPFMAQGHVAPFRFLAELVRRARPDASITIVATPWVSESLRATLAASNVDVHALPFNPADHGLPADAHSSASIGPDQLGSLFGASESIGPAFCRFVAGLRATDPAAHVHIMADMFLGWTVGIARDDAGVSHSIVFTCGSYGAAVYFSLWNSVPLGAFSAGSTDDAFVLPQFPQISVRRSQLSDQLAAADGKDTRSTFIRKQIAFFSRADALIVNTAENLEPKGLRMLQQWFNVPAYPVGPLLRTTVASSSSSSETKDTSSTIFAWLDKQLPGSVLYVSFGSQFNINATQMMELAIGLEQSAHNFVWVIRPPSGFDVNRECWSEWLPDGFNERLVVTGQGLVVPCWAPQVEILAHAATGAFLTHCGWNSVQESLAHGVPLIGWPLSAEQFYNAKMLVEEMAVCVEVARGSDGVRRERITEVVAMVLGDTLERAALRRNAAVEAEKLIRAAGENDRNGSSVKVMQRFFNEMSHLA